jgi:hypothetical protein
MKSGENVIFFELYLFFLITFSIIDIELNKGSSSDAVLVQRTGLCPDMCCERERLTREFQRLSNTYELDPDNRSVCIIERCFFY